MLFSQPQLAAYLSAQFECAWQSLRPAPHVRIDFGDGEVLDRTIGGNVITWFCLPDGRAFDVQPGVMTAEAYLLAADHARALHDELRAASAEDLTATAAAIAAREARGWVAFVRSYVPQLGQGTSLPLTLAPDTLAALPSPLPATPGFQDFLSKAIVEQPLVAALGAVPLERNRSPLEDDTVRARRALRPQALGLLGNFPLSRPKDLTRAVYCAILGIDPEDRYLGLAPVLLGRVDGFTGE